LLLSMHWNSTVILQQCDLPSLPRSRCRVLHCPLGHAPHFTSQSPM
jgi:hypothetical protein